MRSSPFSLVSMLCRYCWRHQLLFDPKTIVTALPFVLTASPMKWSDLSNKTSLSSDESAIPFLSIMQRELASLLPLHCPAQPCTRPREETSKQAFFPDLKLKSKEEVEREREDEERKYFSRRIFLNFFFLPCPCSFSLSLFGWTSLREIKGGRRRGREPPQKKKKKEKRKPRSFVAERTEEGSKKYRGREKHHPSFLLPLPRAGKK